MSRQTRLHPALGVAAGASAAAGLVHAAAAGSHADLTTLSRLFALTALLQVGWAVAVVVRPSRALAVVGGVVNLGALVAWGVAATVGIGWIEGLEGGQAVGLQDGTTVLLEAVAVVAVVAGLVLPAPAQRLRLPVVPVLAALALVAAVPAMATPHGHSGDHADDDHAHGEPIADGEVASGDAHDDGHDHATGSGTGEVAGAAETRTVELTDDDLGYPAAFVEWLDTAPDAAARARAQRLLIATNAAMERFPDEQSLIDAGYTSIGDGRTGWEHYINIGLIADDKVLDPSAIESIVLRVNPDGTKEVASAMYLLGFGTTMDDVPDIAGDLTPWHDHQNLCWEGARVVGTTDRTGSCERGTLRATQPMMHVWVTEHPCGPFAGIEGSHGDGCAHDH